MLVVIAAGLVVDPVRVDGWSRKSRSPISDGSTPGKFASTSDDPTSGKPIYNNGFPGLRVN